MTLTLTNVIIEDTLIIDHGISDDELREMSFTDVFDRVKDQLDPEMNYRFYVNNEPLELRDMDMFVYQDDIINILEQPAGTFTFGALLKMLSSAVLSMALSFVANKLFAAKEMHLDDTQANASYSLNNQQNIASAGAYAGVGYGTFRLYPKIISQPFTWYQDNDQYFGRMLSVGHGYYAIEKLQLGTTEMTHDKDVVFMTGHLNGDKASSIISKLPPPFNAGWTHDIVNAVDLVGNNAIKLMGADYYEPRLFQLKPDIEAVAINIVYMEGLYHIKGNGSLEAQSRKIIIEFLNSAKAVVSTKEQVFSSAKNFKDAVRKTLKYNKPANTDWSYVRVRREKAAGTQSNLIDNPRLEAIYELYPNEPRHYGNNMVMAVAMRASESVQGGTKVNVFARRADVGNSIKDIITDIYSNTQYGAGMDASDLEFSDIAAHTRIDCYFEGEQTVLDAMEKVASPQMFHIVPRAQLLQVIKDVPKSIPVQKYDGYSMYDVSVEYKFDIKEQHDGIEVEYRDDEWNPITTRFPQHSLQPKLVKVFGVSKKTVADTYAKYLYKQEKARRKLVSFSTDVQGRIPTFLDLIEIKHITVSSDEVPSLFQVVKAQVDEDRVQFDVINYDSSIYS